MLVLVVLTLVLELARVVANQDAVPDVLVVQDHALDLALVDVVVLVLDLVERLVQDAVQDAQEHARGVVYKDVLVTAI